jgi:hypothetical protein
VGVADCERGLMFPEKGSALFPLLLSRRDIGRPRCMIDSSRASGTVVS